MIVGFISAAYMRGFQDKEEEKEFDLGSDEPEVPLPLTVTSRVRHLHYIIMLDFQGKKSGALHVFKELGF